MEERAGLNFSDISQNLPLLSVKNLSKRFGNKQVLADINFSVDKGSIFALIGPNGAGKTTTIRSILNSIEPDGGTIELYGEKIDFFAKQNIATLSEDRTVFRNFTALDYEKLYSALYPKWDSQVFRGFLSKYGFDLSQKVETYSIGMKTLFFVILCLSTNADLLILDEPTQHLDPTVRYEVMRLIRDYITADRACIISSHEMFELEEYATEFAIINSGKVIYTDSIDSAKEKHRVIKPENSIPGAEVIGLVGDEVLVRLNGEIEFETGRFPRLHEIVVAYLSRK